MRRRLMECAGAVGLALGVGSLYYLYLTLPLLAWLTIGQLRAAQATGGLLLGALSASWVRSPAIVAFASTVGIVVGGSWTELTMPTDMRRSVIGAFLIWSRLLWFDLALTVVATGLGALAVARDRSRTSIAGRSERHP